MSIGTTRNLTSQFLKYRNDAKRSLPGGGNSHQDKATARLVGAALDGPGAHDVELANTTAFAPSWVQKAEKVRVDMNLVKERLTRLKEAHNKALLVSFDTDNSSKAHAEALTREVQSMFTKIKNEIQNLGEGGNATDDAVVRQQVQKQLVQALTGLMNEHRKEQTRFLNKVEQQKGLTAGSSIGLVESESTMNLNEQDPGFTQAQLAMVDINSALAEERDQEIRRILETINELAQIMKDLGSLVVEQGTLLDRIDHNIVQTADKVEAGLQQIVQADKTQKAGRMMLCIIALVVAIVFLLIIVIIRHA